MTLPTPDFASVGLVNGGTVILQASSITGTQTIDLPAGLGGSGVATLSTIAALTSATSTSLSNTAVMIDGYYAAGDGGGGMFWYNSSDTTTATNGGTVIVDASSRRWYRLWDDVSLPIKAWGAYSDNTHDDSTAIQNGINFLQSGTVNGGGKGGKLLFPAATTLINAGVTLSYGGIVLEGVGWEEYEVSGTTYIPGTHASWVNTTSTSASPITIGAAANVPTIRGIAFMQAQPADAPGWTPTVYPPTINRLGASQNTGGALLENLFCWNCYEFIRIGSTGNPTGRVDMRRIYGMPLNYGIHIIFSADINHLDDIHFWPFQLSESNIQSWVKANGSAFYFIRSDNFEMTGGFCYGYNVGMLFGSSTDGSTQNFQVVNFQADTCNNPIFFSNTSSTAVSGRMANVVVDNCINGMTSSNDSTSTVQLDIANFTAATCQQAGVHAILGCDWRITNFRVQNWSLASSGGYGGIIADSGAYVYASAPQFFNGYGSPPNTSGAGTIIVYPGAGTPVSQSGAVTTGHLATWLATGEIQDGGVAVQQVGVTPTNAHTVIWNASGQIEDGGLLFGTVLSETGSRAFSTTYTNSTGLTFTVYVTGSFGSTEGNIAATVNGTQVAVSTAAVTGDYMSVVFTVPISGNYEVTVSSGSGAALFSWIEQQ